MIWFGILFSFFVLTAEAQTDAKAENDFYNQVVSLFNKKSYDESLKLLESNPQYADTSPRWHYFKGINKLRLEDYDEAIESLNTYIEKNTIVKSPRASYYLGVAYFYKSEYEKALNSLQLSLDMSRDPKMDAVTEAFLEKTVKYQDYYESHKRTTLLLLLGYGFKSNALDVSQDLSEENLNGHAVNYGLSIGHRVVDKLNLVVEPTFNFIDKYSLDHKLSESGLIQSNDTMQLLFALPVIYKAKSEHLLFNFSLNSYASYLPIATTTRELYLTSNFLTAKVGYDLNAQHLLESSLVVASDETKVYSGTDSDATGFRYGLNFLLSKYTDRLKLQVLNLGLGFTQKMAKGNDVYYENSSLTAGYTISQGEAWVYGVNSSIDYIVYPKNTTSRTDLKTAAGLSVTQNFANSNLNYSLGYMVNNSNDSFYKYNDIQASVTFVYRFGF